MDSFKVMDRKMAEMLTFHQEGHNGPEQWAWGYRIKDNEKMESRPATLEEYYEMEYDDGNNPFSRFNARGSKSWSNGDMTLKLKDVAGSDGAAALVVKPHWRVKVKIEFGDANTWRFRQLTNSSGQEFTDAFTLYNSHLTDELKDAIGQDYKNYIAGYFKGQHLSENQDSTSYSERQNSNKFYVSKNEIWMVLDGDSDDEIHVDIDGEHGDIGQLYLSAGGRVFNTTTKLDDSRSSGGGDNWVKITLAGVYYKPSEFGDGKIEVHRGYEIVHDIGRGVIEAIDSNGAVLFTQTYFINTDAKAVRNYIRGELDYSEQVALRDDAGEGGCPQNATYDADNNRCVCDEGYVTDMFGEECVVKEEDEGGADTLPKGCPANSSKGDDGFCRCNEGYKYDSGVCVEDDGDDTLSATELLEKYGIYALLAVGSIFAVSMLKSN